MYQMSRQFSGVEPQWQEPSKEFKYSVGVSTYAYLNLMIDYQIKQAKLEELNKKTKEYCPQG